MQFHNLTTSALHGNYHETDPTFFGASGVENHSTRLRALTHHLNSDFSSYVRDNGQKRKVVSGELDEDSVSMEPEEVQLLVTEREMRELVKEIYINSRERELPGNYNHVLMSELFHVQSSRWYTIADDHLATLYSEIEAFVKAVLNHITRDSQILAELWEITKLSLQESKHAADEELSKLCQDEKQQPITYNHYYTDNVQKARQESTRNLIKRAMTEASADDWNDKLHINNNTVDAEKLLASLQKRIIVNINVQACIKALIELSIYYKTSSPSMTLYNVNRFK
ncbi:MAG: hypothetical protein ASARMPREDX12_006514 [Alectoria sarmentosa]|nr:MAG: hypothetical protein ASARMPREDX12_006514 [Alectoria sarmentosa]